MVRTYKKSFIFIGLCALSGQQTQANKFSDVAAALKNKSLAAHEASVSVCQSTASHIPGLVLTSAALRTLSLVARSLYNKSVVRGEGCPLGALTTGFVPKSMKDQTFQQEGAAAGAESSIEGQVVVDKAIRTAVRVGDFVVNVDIPAQKSTVLNAVRKSEVSFQLPSAKNLVATAAVYGAYLTLTKK